MQELVCERGFVDGIEFDIKTRRYKFWNNDPLGALPEPKTEEFPGGEYVNNFEEPKF